MVLDYPMESMVRTLYVSAALRSFCAWLSVHAATFAIWVKHFFSHPSFSSLFLKPHPTRAGYNSTPSLSWRLAPDDQVESSRKCRFTVHYCCKLDDDIDAWEAQEDDEQYELASPMVAGLADMDRRFSTFPLRRMSDLRWYKSQDMSILDGNVVRLWTK